MRLDTDSDGLGAFESELAAPAESRHVRTSAPNELDFFPREESGADRPHGDAAARRVAKAGEPRAAVASLPSPPVLPQSWPPLAALVGLAVVGVALGLWFSVQTPEAPVNPDGDAPVIAKVTPPTDAPPPSPDLPKVVVSREPSGASVTTPGTSAPLSDDAARAAGAPLPDRPAPSVRATEAPPSNRPAPATPAADPSGPNRQPPSQRASNAPPPDRPAPAATARAVSAGPPAARLSVEPSTPATRTTQPNPQPSLPRAAPSSLSRPAPTVNSTSPADRAATPPPVAVAPEPAPEAAAVAAPPDPAPAAASPSPAPPAGATPVRPPTPPPAATEVADIQAALKRYASAFSSLNASAVHDVWPTVDSRALTRAFRGLQEQLIAFDACEISALDASASATCAGSVQYVPRIGSKAPRTERRQWQFKMRRIGGRWLIDDVASR